MKTMQSILKCTLIIFSSIIIASLFGVLHNQLSFSVSTAFFENFLFRNFGINEWKLDNPRIGAAIVGILGSYWVGFYLGLFYAVIFLFLKTKNDLKNIFIAITINIGTAFLGSLTGYLVSSFLIPPAQSGIFVDFGTTNPENYIQAAYMHTGSYYGGVAGLVLGIIFLLKVNSTMITEKNGPQQQ
jgi:hypothetical protein